MKVKDSRMSGNYHLSLLMIPKICYRYARKITWREIKKSYTVLENAAILIFVLSSVVYLGNVMSSVYRFLVLFPVSIKQRALKYGFYFRLFNRSLNTGAKILCQSDTSFSSCVKFVYKERSDYALSFNKCFRTGSSY